MSVFFAEGKLATVLNRLGDLIILNILTIICCIPVITIGSAITSLYEQTLKMVKNEEGKILSSYFHSFMSNMKKSTGIWLIGVGISVFLVFGVYMLRNFDSKWIQYYRGTLLILCFIVLLFTYFSLVTAARFENTFKNTIKNGILFCVVHFINSFLVFVGTLIPIAVVCYFTRLWYVMILVGISGPAYLSSIYFRRLFKDFE